MSAFPGTPFTSSHHFAVFMRGDTPLTSRLLKPVLLDGETGEVSDARDLPVYLKALLVSQPLHFGDYGGMPLKIIWGAARRHDDRRDRQRAVSVDRQTPQAPQPRHRGAACVAAVAMIAARKSRSSGNWWTVYGGPLLLGVLSVAGLLTALLSEGTGHYFSRIGVGTPIDFTGWFFARRK